MKERIERLIDIYKQELYDIEMSHIEYDSILEDFVLNYDPQLLPLISALIAVDKKMWYA